MRSVASSIAQLPSGLDPAVALDPAPVDTQLLCKSLDARGIQCREIGVSGYPELVQSLRQLWSNPSNRLQVVCARLRERASSQELLA
jgi:hypothetical protein